MGELSLEQRKEVFIYLFNKAGKRFFFPVELAQECKIIIQDAIDILEELSSDRASGIVKYSVPILDDMALGGLEQKGIVHKRKFDVRKPCSDPTNNFDIKICYKSIKITDALEIEE